MNHRWPLGVAAALLLVIAVNLAVAFYAVAHPPQIVESYESTSR